MNLGQLAILPASDAEEVSHDIALLFAVQFGHVLVGTHVDAGVILKRGKKINPVGHGQPLSGHQTIDNALYFSMIFRDTNRVGKTRNFKAY